MRRDYPEGMRNAKALATLARRRLQARRWLASAGPSALVATAVAAMALVACRVLGSTGLWVSAVGFALAFAVSMRALLALRPPPSLSGAAAELDERLALDGRVSSALALAGRQDAFARAAVEDGERVAGEPGRAGQVRRAFALQPPASMAWLPVALGALSLMAWMVPVRVTRTAESAVTSAGRTADPAEQSARADAAQERVQAAVQAIEESPEARARLDDLLAEVARPPEAQPARSGESSDAESQARREADALQRASSIEQRLERELDTPEMQSLTQVADAMSRLPVLSGAGAELSQALKSGDLSKAQQQMQKLAPDAAGGDPKAAAEARQALEQLASAMERSAEAPSAEQRQALEQALRQAGLDPALAKDPAAAQAAAQKAAQQGKCSESQAQQVGNKAKSQQQAQQQQREMANSMRECSSGSSGGASRQLSRQQAQRRMQAALQTAMRQCNSPSELGWSMPWQRQPPSPQGGGSGKGGGNAKGGKGKPGEGGAPRTDGRTRELADASVGERQESVGDGDPLDAAAARDFVRAQGTPVGTSREQVRAVAAKVAEGLEEGSEEDPVPARLKAAHKRYFEEWKRRVDPAAPAPARPANP